jgi:ferredoxin
MEGVTSDAPGGEPIAAVTVNARTCIGCGRCVGTVPEVFRMRKGKCQVREGPDLAQVEAILQAERQCPSKSIRTSKPP